MLNKIRDQISPQYRSRVAWFLAIVLMAIFIEGFNRLKENYDIRKSTKEQSIIYVQTVTAKTSDAKDILILPGNVVAWHESPIYARANGYIKKWLVDIGYRVKKGQLLAIIEIPEVEAELRQAEADLNTAIANYNLAQSTSERWKNLLKTESVSVQETDERVSAEKSLYATMNAARAKRDMLRDLVSFKNVVAPFDGIITNRTTDIGALINEGSNSTIPSLFSIAQADKLRIYVNVPQIYSSRMTPDVQTTLYFSEHPGKKYKAKLLQTAKAIDPTSRTLLCEFETDNSSYELLPGGYTQVSLNFSSSKNSISLPVNTLVFRSAGLQVATVNKDNKVIYKSIHIARDYGTYVELDSGIEVGDKVIINPPDSLMAGAAVEIVTPRYQKSDVTKS